MSVKRLAWEVMGRQIGTATGWDQVDTWIMALYDFVPVEGTLLPSGSLINFDFEKGTVTKYDDDGNVLEIVDFVEAVSHLENINL